MTSVYVNWGGKVKLTWRKDYIPPTEFITSSHGFCFFKGNVLLVDLNHRGWDIPGGHIENGETPEQCFKREAMEEGYVEGDCKFLGAVEVDHHENTEWDSASKYPLVGYQLFYRMDVENIHPFEAHFESLRRVFTAPESINQHMNLGEIHQAILDYSLQTKVRG